MKGLVLHQSNLSVWNCMRSSSSSLTLPANLLQPTEISTIRRELFNKCHHHTNNMTSPRLNFKCNENTSTGTEQQHYFVFNLKNVCVLSAHEGIPALPNYCGFYKRVRKAESKVLSRISDGLIQCAEHATYARGFITQHDVNQLSKKKIQNSMLWTLHW